MRAKGDQGSCLQTYVYCIRALRAAVSKSLASTHGGRDLQAMLSDQQSSSTCSGLYRTACSRIQLEHHDTFDPVRQFKSAGPLHEFRVCMLRALLGNPCAFTASAGVQVLFRLVESGCIVIHINGACLICEPPSDFQSGFRRRIPGISTCFSGGC